MNIKIALLGRGWAGVGEKAGVEEGRGG